MKELMKGTHEDHVNTSKPYGVIVWHLQFAEFCHGDGKVVPKELPVSPNSAGPMNNCQVAAKTRRVAVKLDPGSQPLDVPFEQYLLS